MNSDQISLRRAGMFFIRVLLGLIFFFQGYGKIFTMGMGQVYSRFFKDFEATILPKWLIVSSAYYTSYAELIGGSLLILGLFRKQAYYMLALDLLIVSFGHGFMEPIWDLSHVLPRTVLLGGLFMLPREWDVWNSDALVKERKK